MPVLLDGKKISEEIKKKITLEVAEMKKCGKMPPHLGAVLVGDNPASHTYVNAKVKACEEVGFRSSLFRLPGTVTEEDLLRKIVDLNSDNSLHGFIVQLPLPSQINEQKIKEAVAIHKDVDGFHPVNFGKMALNLPCFVPATPYGIMQLLDHYGIKTEGMQCVVLGRSHIVGLPMSVLMMRKASPGNCTVTVCHSKSRDIASHASRADILIVAMGRMEFLTTTMVKEGAVVVDVGIHRIKDDTKKSGYRLVGDVKFDEVAPRCSYITPVPGGVGPMTIAGLLLNALKAAGGERYRGIRV